jgi:imidazolonepropionase-like amidohydrolase
LSNYAIADRVYIDGQMYYDRTGDEQRLTELQKEKATLLAAEKNQRRPPTTTEESGAIASGPASGSSANPGQRHSPRAPSSGEPRGTTGTGPGRSNQVPAGTPQEGEVWAITNARIHPVTGSAIERGTVLIRGSKIDAVGAGVAIPPGVRTVDAAGGHVYPGWINARTTLGLAEPGPRGFDDVSELLDFNPELRAVVAYHSDSDAIPVARANGVTTTGVFPAGGILGGQVAVMNLDGWTWEESTLRPSAGVTFQFPTIGRTGGFFFGDQPPDDRSYEDLKKERDEKLDRLARLLEDARAYARIPAGQRRRNWALEALIPVVERRAPLYTAAGREQEIRDAIEFAERVNVRIVLTGAQEAALVTTLLKDKNIPVILGPVLTLPTREDMFHAATYQAAGELARAGVKFAFATGDNTNVRLLPYHASQSVAWGLDRDEAIKALTLHAAEILEVADRVGSIEPGKDANLLIAAGDPLEVRTQITHVVIGGQNVDLGNKHEALYERFMARP